MKLFDICSRHTGIPFGPPLLNVGKRTIWHDRSLTTIILYSMTNLSHPSYYDKTKRTNRKGLDIRKIMTRYGRSLTPTIAYDTIGLSHPSYYNKTKKTNKKRTRHQIKNDMLRQVSPIGKENNTNTRPKRTNHRKT